MTRFTSPLPPVAMREAFMTQHNSRVTAQALAQAPEVQPIEPNEPAEQTGVRLRSPCPPQIRVVEIEFDGVVELCELVELTPEDLEPLSSSPWHSPAAADYTSTKLDELRGAGALPAFPIGPDATEEDDDTVPIPLLSVRNEQPTVALPPRDDLRRICQGPAAVNSWNRTLRRAAWTAAGTAAVASVVLISVVPPALADGPFHHQTVSAHIDLGWMESRIRDGLIAEIDPAVGMGAMELEAWSARTGRMAVYPLAALPVVSGGH
ncbi:hypothetical protein ACFL5O_04410 [Myxococcota bacterium]